MKTCVCATCGKVFETNHKRKYCCPACRDSVRLKDWTDVVWSKCNPHPPCLWCGKQATRHDQNGFCSRDCANAYKVYVNQYEREKEARLVEVGLFSYLPNGIEEQERRRVIRKLASVLRVVLKQVPRISRCAICGKPIYWHMGRQPKYCSRECSERSEISKANKRKAKAVRLYRLRAVADGTIKYVDPFEVFERDGWSCQLCGCSTPKSLRGTYEPNAPELDHIIPVSKGGAHTEKNLQCLCRACNIAKSDAYPRRGEDSEKRQKF